MDAENEDAQQGIKLALDPNLITLPLDNLLSITPSSFEDGQDNNAGEASRVEQPSKVIGPTMSLVNNPHEIYGKMPIAQLIPLILKQHGPEFRFADLSEEAFAEDIESCNTSKANYSKSIDSKNSPENSAMDIDIDNQDSKYNIPSSDLSNGNTDIVNRNDFELASKSSNEFEVMTQEKYIRLRKAMMENINLAMNESSLALEFVSLLLSSVRESSGKSSMSPFLKNNVPTKSLSADKITYKKRSHEEELDIKLLSKGWQLKSLNESRNLLKDNHAKLEGIVRKERLYWKKISENISENDVIFKMRDRSTGNRSLGIKYGYEDSGSNYRHDRGVAILRDNLEKNYLELVPVLSSNPTTGTHSKRREKFLRVRLYTKIDIEDDFILTGESDLDTLIINQLNGIGQEDLRTQIKNLKFFIFEQELMHQLKKECGKLLSYGITVENEDKILVELPNEKIEIELLSLDDDSVANHQQDAPRSNNKRANMVLIMLRLLLIVIFKKNLRRRIASQATMAYANAGSTPNQDILLIRPILGRLRQHNYINLLRKVIKSYVLDEVRGSVIKEYKQKHTDVKNTDQFTRNLEALDSNVAKLTRDIDAFVDVLNIGSYVFEIGLPHDAGSLSLTLRSTNYCNALVGVCYSLPESNINFDTSFAEFKEVEEFLYFIVTEYINRKSEE